jgi:hypothetical protein
VTVGGVDTASGVLDEGDEMLSRLRAEAVRVTAAVERGCHPSAIVCPSGQPIRRSHSVGVRRRTEDEPVVVVVPSDAGVSVGTDSEGRVDVWDEGVDVLVVSLACGADDSASDVNAWSSSGGSVLPRFDARRRMPAAARADR